MHELTAIATVCTNPVVHARPNSSMEKISKYEFPYLAEHLLYIVVLVEYCL